MNRYDISRVLFALMAFGISACGGGGSSGGGGTVPSVPSGPTGRPTSAPQYAATVQTIVKSGLDFSQAVAFDPDDGNAYVGGEYGRIPMVARVTPKGQVHVLFQLNEVPQGVAYNPRDKQLYVTTKTQGILRVSTSGTYSTYVTSPAFLSGITVDPRDGTLYVAGSDRIYKIAPNRRVTTFSQPGLIGYPGPPSYGGTFGLTFDAKHRQLLVADTYHKEVWRGTLSGDFTVIAGSCVIRPSQYRGCLAGTRDGEGRAAQLAWPVGVAYDVSSDTAYITDGNRVRTVSPSGYVKSFAASGADGSTDGIGEAATFFGATGVTIDPASGLLYVLDTDNGALRTVSTRGSKAPPPPPAVGQVTVSGIPTLGAQPSGIAWGSDGHLWFGEPAVGQIGRMTTSGEFAEFKLPRGYTGPGAMTLGPDQRVWFGASHIERFLPVPAIGRISPNGATTFIIVPGAQGIGRMVTGPDGNVWFTDPFGGAFDRVTPGGRRDGVSDRRASPSPRWYHRRSRWQPLALGGEWLHRPSQHERNDDRTVSNYVSGVQHRIRIGRPALVRR